jgi:hypothetical protein
MQKHAKQHTRVGLKADTMAPIKSWGLIALLMAITSSTALTTQRLPDRFPGASLRSDTNSNVRIPLGIVPPVSSLSTKLLYSHSDNVDDEIRRNEHRAAVSGVRSRLTGWWSTMFDPTISNVGDNGEQQKVDEYLEFLDKRYHRLHDVEAKRVSLKAAKSFPVLDWLMDNGQKDASFASAQSQENALFVLGVAELASTRLLQKHHIPVKGADRQPAIDTMAYTIPLKSNHSRLLGDLANPSTSFLDHVRAWRRALIAFQGKQIKKLFVLTIIITLQTPSKLVSAVKAIWKHGGGRKTLGLSLGVLSACFFVLRPIGTGLVGVVFESGLTKS